MKAISHFKISSLALVWLWLILFALLPFLLIVFTSFLSIGETRLVSLPITLANYANVFDPIYLKIFFKSFYSAGITTVLCLIIGYPFAYILAKFSGKYKPWLLMLVIIPFWTSSLIRSYAMLAILKAKGILNYLLISAGIIHTPLQILYTNTAVIIGLVYNLLPFMIFPLYSNLERLDDDLVDAAKDLGANRLTIFTKIILPLSLPGIIGGSMLVFLPAMTLFYIPDILGGAKSILLGNLIEQLFLLMGNWPFGSAVSVILTLIMGAMLLWYWFNSKAKDRRDLL